MNGYSATNVFTDKELELHRQATTLVGLLPEVPGTRCHELARAMAILLRYNSLRLKVVDGKFGLVDHSWIETGHSYKHIILDVYSVGSVPMVQLHDAGSLLIRNARVYTEGPPRDDIKQEVIEALLHRMEQRQNCHTRSPL